MSIEGYWSSKKVLGVYRRLWSSEKVLVVYRRSWDLHWGISSTVGVREPKQEE